MSNDNEENLPDKLDPLIKPENVKTRVNEQGYLESFDIETGRIVAIQENFHGQGISDGLKGFSRMLIDGQEVLVPTGLDPNKVRLTKGLKFNPVVADIILQLICEGGMITRICKKPGYPDYATIQRWRAQNPEFDAAYQNARQARAEIRHDDVMKSVEKIETLSKDEMNALKLKIDTYKWSASVNDPVNYGNRRNESAAQGGGVQIVVNTGITRDNEAIEIDPHVQEVIETMDFMETKEETKGQDNEQSEYATGIIRRD